MAGTDYQILEDVAKEEGFDFKTLTDMFIMESSGERLAVTGSKVGPFQLSEDVGKKHGIITNKADYRTSVEHSARATIKLYKDNIKSFHPYVVNSINQREKDIGKKMDPGFIGYIAHQQGSFGFQDIITGAYSGHIRKNVRNNMFHNLGFTVYNKDGSVTKEYKKNKKKFPNTVDGNKALAKHYLNFWDTRYVKKQKQAERWRKKSKDKIDAMSFDPDSHIMKEVLVNP
jgi:hypothetical protein